MKKNIKFILSLALLFIIGTSFVSCGDDDEETVKKELSVTPVELEYTSEGGYKVINLSVDASTSWTISNTADWCTFSSISGTGNKNVNVNASKNELEEGRFTTITVSDGSTSIDVQISQEGSIIDLAVNPTEIEFTKAGGKQEFVITAGAVTSWEIIDVPSWLTLSKTADTGTQTILATVGENIENENRTVSLKINTASAVVEIKIQQAFDVGLYPNYNTDPIADDTTGMMSTAVEIAAQINLGWNIGNSLEAIGGETAWGNPVVTKDLIDLVKQNGFNAIRIPCSWNQNLANSETAEIKEEWLNRVKEVVQYCVDNDMYTILNIHWDGGWLENNCTTDKQEENNAKQKAFWEQIATYLRDFDEHLLFASANEPNVDNATEMSVLNSYHQTFIDAVRSTGGKNAYRTLVVQGPKTNIEATKELMTTLPTDSATDRMMVEVHYYDPWQFAGLTTDETWGNAFYYWGADYHSTTDTTRNATWGEEDSLETEFKVMKTQFVDKGIPVVLGEFGAIRRTTLTGSDLELHLNSRAYYIKYVTERAIANGMIPFYWDEGSLENHGFGIFDRSDNTVFDQQVLTALQEGAE